MTAENINLVDVGASLTAVGLIGWLVRHTFKHTIPRLSKTYQESVSELTQTYKEALDNVTKCFREECKEYRAEISKQRQEFREELREHRDAQRELHKSVDKNTVAVAAMREGK